MKTEVSRQEAQAEFLYLFWLSGEGSCGEILGHRMLEEETYWKGDLDVTWRNNA